MLQVTWLVLTNQSAIISAFEHYSNFYGISPGSEWQKNKFVKDKAGVESDYYGLWHFCRDQLFGHKKIALLSLFIRFD